MYFKQSPCQTYNSDYMVPDSSSTAFAMYSGVKTTGYTMGFDNTIGYMKLETAENATRPTTILDWAQVTLSFKVDVNVMITIYSRKSG